MFKSKNRGYATESESEEEQKIPNEIKPIKKPLKKSTKKQRALKEGNSKLDKFQFDQFPTFTFGEKQISKSEDFTNFRFTTEPITEQFDIIEPKIKEQEPKLFDEFSSIVETIEPFVFSKGKIELIDNPMPVHNEFDFIGKQNDIEHILKQNHQELLTIQKQFAATQKDFAISQNEFLILQKALFKLQEDFKIELVNLQTKNQYQIETKTCEVNEAELANLQAKILKIQTDHEIEMQKHILQSSYQTKFGNNVKNITFIAGGFICYSLFLFNELQRSNFF